MSELTEEEKSRIIEMAWEDRTPFDAIKAQVGLPEQEVKGCPLEKPSTWPIEILLLEG